MEKVDFSGEDWNVPAQIADGVWVIATRHNPGLASGLELNNRTFVFKLQNKSGARALLAFGCGDAKTIEAVQQIELQTGHSLDWVVSNGGTHHLYLELWYQAFPRAHLGASATHSIYTEWKGAFSKIC